MSWLLASIYDRFMAKTEAACLATWRRELLSKAQGRVLELGAGTGINLEAYGGELERLVLSEPDPAMRRLLEARIGASGRAAELSPASAEALPFPDASFDVVVGTLILCSITDVPAALAEVKRVLVPGGSYLFIEHVGARNRPRRRRWQERLEPFWSLIADGCRLTRETDQALLAAGLELESCRRESLRKALPVLRPSIRGVARKPRAL